MARADRVRDRAHGTAGFTEAGSLAYDHPLDFFGFRVQLTAGEENAVCDRGKALGADFRGMKASATDMDLVKGGRRR